MEWLFSYGTLQQEDVQQANFGRLLEGHADQLPGYTIGSVQITDARVIRESGKDIHPILRRSVNPNDRVEGTVYALSQEELARADDYEVDDYIRVEAELVSGRRCWIYAAADELE